MEDEMEIEIPNNTNGPGNNTENNEDSSTQEGAIQKENQEPEAHNYDDDEDGSICPICLDSWTNCGDHRICSVKCGHIFGYACILRWLDSQAKKTCPTCKKPIKRSDLRFIYAKKLVAVDNMEIENMKRKLEEAHAQKNAALQNVSKYISREHVLQQEIEQLKRKVQELTIGSKPTDFRLTLNSPLSRLRLYLEKNIEVCNKIGCRNCRVFDISVPQDLIFIAARSPNELFGGYGLKKLSLSTYRPIKFIPLHKDSIRDMCLHPVNKTVLTVSTDKKFRITETNSTNTVFTVSLESPGWSCGWSPRHSEEFYIGAQNGTISIFDVRNLQLPKASLTVPGDFSPVVSLTAIREESLLDILLVAKLNTLWAFESLSDGSFSRHLLPLEGPFLSLKYDQESRQILVSSRPNSHLLYARHTVCHLEKTHDPDLITSNVVHTFKGGTTAKLLAKTSCFLPNNIVAAHHETKKSIFLYSLNTGEEVGSCPTHDNSVLDIKGFSAPSGKFLAYLNEKKLEFFKFNTS